MRAVLVAAPVVDWDVQYCGALSWSELAGLRGCNSHPWHLMAGAGHSSDPLLQQSPASHHFCSRSVFPIKPEEAETSISGGWCRKTALFGLQEVSGGLGHTNPGGFARGIALLEDVETFPAEDRVAGVAVELQAAS